MGGVIDLQLLRRHARPQDARAPVTVDADPAVAVQQLRERRAQLLQTMSSQCEIDGHGPCTSPRPCAGYDAIGEVLQCAAGAEAHLEAALERGAEDRTSLDRLADASRSIGAIDGPEELVPAIPRLALLVCPATAAALVHVYADGAVETVARTGPAFVAAPWEIGDEARGALRERGAGAPAGSEPARHGPVAAVPLARGAEGLVLVVERAEETGRFSDREVERLALYASLANTALSGARARAALQEAAARDAATLGAVRDGVLALDKDGIVRAVNQAAAAALGVRRDDVLGRRLAEVPGLAPLAGALASPTQAGDVVALPRGEVTLRTQLYEGGLVATLRDVATEQTNAQRMVGSVARYTFDNLVGAAPEFMRVVEEADRAAHCDAPLLICGESGTGKEMLAQAIHNASARASEPFLGINVTAIPRELLESELFGYEGGTFTGARNTGRAGKFELAGRGTLLLDEIGDMPLDMQSKLLRVLQEKIVQRLGSARDIPVRARIIATTHCDLGDAVKQGKFRLDLYHRLRVLQLRLPPLKERRQDIPAIVRDQLRRHHERSQRRVEVAPHVMDALQAYDWPGNVRELQNVIEGELSLLAPGADVLARIPPVLQSPVRPRGAVSAPREVLPLEEVERRACEEALAYYDGNVARAAKALGVAKGTLYSKMKRWGIATPDGPGSRA